MATFWRSEGHGFECDHEFFLKEDDLMMTLNNLRLEREVQMSASVMWGMAIGRHIDVCSLVFPFPKLRQEKDGRSGLLTLGITKILSSSHIASIIYFRYLTSRGINSLSFLYGIISTLA